MGMITRRLSFRAALGALAAMVAATAATCSRVYGAVSRWSWPGYPLPSALRSHLANSENHPFSERDVAGKSFTQLIAMHERDHGGRRGDKPRWTSPRQVPKTSTGRVSAPSPPPSPPRPSSAPGYMGAPGGPAKPKRSSSRPTFKRSRKMHSTTMGGFRRR